MPIFVYRHPKTKEEREVIQSVHEEHVYIDDKGVKWNRVFTVPNASIDSKIDPLNSRDFVEKTGRKRGNLGNIIDASKEASEKRKQIMGHDPIKKKYWDDYAKKRKGKRHPKSFED